MKLKKKKINLRKKIQKPKVKKEKAKKQPYFGKDAHLAIIDYQNTNNQCEKNKIYSDKIRPSFDKLVENLIFIHGFSSDKTSFEVLKTDCVSFLFEILQKFDPEKGSKAFSYFNVCAKNFLIIQSKKKKKEKSRSISIFDESLTLADQREIEYSQVISSQESKMIINEDKELIFEVIKKIKDKLTNCNEIKCIDAINTIFHSIAELDFLNKRAIFVYLRELSGLNAKQLSVAMSNIRRQYRDVIKNDSTYMLFKDELFDI